MAAEMREQAPHAVIFNGLAAQWKCRGVRVVSMARCDIVAP